MDKIAILLLLVCAYTIAYANDGKNNMNETTTALIKATQTDNIENIKILIENGADVNAIDSKNYTALMHASENGHLEVAKLLLESGGYKTIDARTSQWGSTAYELARRNNHSDVANFLLANRADPIPMISEYPMGKPIYLPTATYELFEAVKNNDLKSVRNLLKTVTDINIRDDRYKTVLMYAARSGYPEIVKLLIEAGADVNVSMGNNSTALILASKNGHRDIARLLIDAGADIDIKDYEGKTALSNASADNDISFAKSLITNGADVNIKDPDGWTPLMFAAKEDHINIVKLLIKNSADINIVDNNGISILMHAYGHVSFYREKESVNYLIQHGADDRAIRLFLTYDRGSNYSHELEPLIMGGTDIDTKDSKGDTILIKAAEDGNIKTVRFALAHGADVSSKNSIDKTALGKSSYRGYFEITKLLIESGADVNTTDKHNGVPLTGAILNSHFDIVKLLIDNGADVNVKIGSSGTTLLSFAMNKDRNIDIAKLLIISGADVHSDDTILITNAARGNIEAVKLLLEQKIDINARNKRGWSALMLASNQPKADTRYTQIIELLLKNGATDKDIALMYATFQNNSEIINLLKKAGAKNK